MAGFVRRYGAYPGLDVLTAIEGVVIIDAAPPGNVMPQSVGVACLVGEFPDMTYATQVDASGVVTSKYQPVEILSTQDIIDKLGGFDSSLGKWGSDLGNGYFEIAGKRFSRLVVVPINLASSKGTRLCRDLPTNAGATNAEAVVPMAPGVVFAGREFANGANKVRVAKRVVFSDATYITHGTNMATAGAVGAATHVFTAAGEGFVAKGVQEGDILVVGVIGAAGAQGTNAGTFRIVSVDSATQLTVQRFDGTAYTTVVDAGALAYRVHPAACADTGGNHQNNEAGGYVIPARPTVATIASIATGVVCAPTTVPPAGTASTWDPLSGLALITLPGASPANDLVYNANIQAPNAANHADFTTQYQAALNALLEDSTPANEVNIVWCARKYEQIMNVLKQHVLTASAQGRGRVACMSPSLDVVDAATATGGASAGTDLGVAAYRDERVFYSWPGCKTYLSEASGLSLLGADGSTVTDGTLDSGMDAFLASTLSTLPPHRNPGEATQFTKLALQNVSAVQRGLTSTLNIALYTLLRQKGVCGLRMDQTAGPIFQSGVTSSLTAGMKNINRRRMADYIQDSLAARWVQLAKQPITEDWKGAVVGEAAGFLEELLSQANPAAQQIAAYQLDDKSGNTAALLARGVFVVIVRVQTLATGDFITLQSEIGEGVVITTQVA